MYYNLTTIIATEKKVTAPPSICKALEKLKLKAKKETSGYESSGETRCS